MSDFHVACPPCVGKLQISSDIQRFVCAYCGNEHVVRRRGGVVALVPVLQSLQGIQHGTDRTAGRVPIVECSSDTHAVILDYDPS